MCVCVCVCVCVSITAGSDDVRQFAVTYTNKKDRGHWLLNYLYPPAKKTNVVQYNVSSAKVPHQPPCVVVIV